VYTGDLVLRGFGESGAHVGEEDRKTNAEFAEGAEGAEKKRMKSGNFVTLGRKSHPYTPRVGHPQVHLIRGTTLIEEHRQECLCRPDCPITTY
jgi:hypothetical protein